MAQAPDTAAEIQRLREMSPDGFLTTVFHFVMGGTDRRCPREIQGPALQSPELAPRTLDAVENAGRQIRTLVPRNEDESKRDHQARVVPARRALESAALPLRMVLDDMAHAESQYLAQLDDTAFARRWTAFVLKQRGGAPVHPRIQGLAFRSPNVAERAARLCALMMEEPAKFLPSAPEESRRARESRIDEFRRSVVNEARFLQFATQYAVARHGRMPSAPNYRLQALQLLAAAHPEEMSKLLRQVRSDGQQAKQENRREDRMARRAPSGPAR